MARVEFVEWLAIGQAAGWVSGVVCDRHEGTPLTEAEVEELDAGDDPCIRVLRVWWP